MMALRAAALAAPFSAICLVLRVGAIGVTIASLELLWHHGDLGDDGILDGEVQLTRSAWFARRWLGRWFGMRLGKNGAMALLVLRLVAALAILGSANTFEVARFGSVTIAVTTLLLRLRSPIGIHASGAMVMVTFTSCGLGLVVGTARSMGFALAFIAGEACLAYFVAGSGKLCGARWREGHAIALIATTRMWGRRREALVLQAHPELSAILCWATILGECAVPLALVVPFPLALLILSGAMLFHLTTAFGMRLNCFVWSFGSTYPAIIYCSDWLHGVHP
jgi:hypothetical protein